MNREQLELELRNELKRLRKQATVLSEYQIARELKMGNDAIYKIETGANLPTERTLQTLYTAYKMTKQEYENVRSLRTQIVTLRKQEKSV